MCVCVCGERERVRERSRGVKELDKLCLCVWIRETKIRVKEGKDKRENHIERREIERVRERFCMWRQSK